MKSLTNIELELIIHALEMKILIYECYGMDQKIEQKLDEHKSLLDKMKSKRQFRNFL